MFDLLLSNKIKDEAIVYILKKCIVDANVEIFTSIEDLKSTGGASFLCLVTEFPAGFPMMISIYDHCAGDTSLPDQLVIGRLFSKHAQCDVLLANDATLNPYSMVMINHEGHVHEIHLNVEMYEQGYYQPLRWNMNYKKQSSGKNS